VIRLAPRCHYLVQICLDFVLLVSTSDPWAGERLSKPEGCEFLGFSEKL
jgi:hypothetical protein